MRKTELNEAIGNFFHNLVNQPEKTPGDVNYILREIYPKKDSYDTEIYDKMIYDRKEKILKALKGE